VCTVPRTPTQINNSTQYLLPILYKAGSESSSIASFGCQLVRGRVLYNINILILRGKEIDLEQTTSFI
jgi:hypothetical protein